VPIKWEVKVEPGDQTVKEGESVVFTAKYTPAAPPAVQVGLRWQAATGRDGQWTDVGGSGAGAQLKVTAAPGMDGTTIRAEVSGGGTTATSAPVVLHVTAPPAPATTAPAQPCPTATDPAAAAKGSGEAKDPKAKGSGDEAKPSGNDKAADKPADPGKPADKPADSAKPADGTSTQATAAACPPATAGEYFGTVDKQVLDLGQEQTAVGHNFVPGSRVKVTLEPDALDLGTVQTAADGTVTTRFDTSRLLAGEHTVTWTPVAP
jgi:hypothetical protein